MEFERESGTSLSLEGLSDECHSNSSKLSAIDKVRKLLFRRMLVGVNDGRFFMGNFHCMDKQGNIILQDAVEFRSVRRSSPSPMEQRGLGLILIPSSCRISCHIDSSVEEQLSLLSLKDI
ncbi:small nuclear ribonucleoprotein-associated protein N [Chenopodium quinoa]|uniref:Sm domain-containing protein n=1 Tax=Chenopodium quinoa TaxID=63459 RepID=A0A803L4F0_CHEQI|nr:small nuclear ribonucleoprotein-associated protein N [Chenopodium quinoa]XP_021734447.1 small nuclear ribonucleoprotein-associated protein N [Chenopodium quinoa]